MGFLVGLSDLVQYRVGLLSPIHLDPNYLINHIKFQLINLLNLEKLFIRSSATLLF